MKDEQHIEAGQELLNRLDQKFAAIPEDKRNAFEQAWVNLAAERQSMTFGEWFDAGVERKKDRIFPDELGKLLNLSRKALLRLPLRQLSPMVRTASGGMRQTVCFSREDVRAFLTDLNPSYATFDFSEPLVKPEELAELFESFEININKTDLRQLRVRGNGPEWVVLNSRVIRYRMSDVFEWLQNPTRQARSLADTIMSA